MAKECFCGCGRAVPRFPLHARSMNKRGRLVSERLAYGEAIVGDSPETIDWVDDGYEIVAELKAAMHGEIDPGSVSEPRIRHWQEYGRATDSAALAFGRPRINEWLRENPEAARCRGKRMNNSRLLFLPLVVAVLLFVACGDDDDESAEKPSKPTPTSCLEAEFPKVKTVKEPPPGERAWRGVGVGEDKNRFVYVDELASAADARQAVNHVRREVEGTPSVVSEAVGRYFVHGLLPEADDGKTAAVADCLRG